MRMQSASGDALHGAGGVGRPVEVLEGLDESVESCDRHADELPWARRVSQPQP